MKFEDNKEKLVPGAKIVLTSSNYQKENLCCGAIGTIKANCISLFNAVLATFENKNYIDSRQYEIKAEDFKIL